MPSPETCDYIFVECGSTITSSTVGRASVVGSPSPVGDVMFLLVLFEPRAIRATTCGPATIIDTAMYLYDDCPAHAGATLLTEQSDEYVKEGRCYCYYFYLP